MQRHVHPLIALQCSSTTLAMSVSTDSVCFV
jgi:hypothetical protein